VHTLLGKAIGDLVDGRSRTATVRTRWGDPLVGVAEATDPLFARLKQVVRPSHALPADLLPGARTVIVYFLPFVKEIPRGNRKGHFASTAWAVAYVETNQLIRDINRHLAGILNSKGFQCTDLPPTHNFDTVELMSDWSHKHAAYIAGLGTFGRHHLLITDKGCCGRLGSLVTDAVLPPTRRSGEEYCLSKSGVPCRVCIRKCVAGALSDDGFDRRRCYALLLENAALHQKEGLADVCGKCSTIVPCSFTNPVKRLHIAPGPRG
jgi:epoxyqueuosine reductase QueG